MNRIRRVLGIVMCIAALLPSRQSLADDTGAGQALEHPGIARGILKGHTDEVLCAAINKDGIVASGAADETARLWKLSTNKELFTLHSSAEVRCVAFSGDGKILATGGPDRLVTVWDVKTGNKIKTLQGMTAPIYMLGLSDDGNVVAAAGDDDGKIWNLNTGKTLMSFEGRFALSPDGSTLATSLARGGIQLTEVSTGKDTLRLTGHLGYANELRFSPDSKSLASGGASSMGIAADPTDPAQDHLVKVWDVQTGKNLATLAGHTNGIGHLMFTPDGKKLVSTDYDGCMKLWDLNTKHAISTLEHVKYGDRIERTPMGHWALAPDLKTWAVGTEAEVLWIDITDFTGK